MAFKDLLKWNRRVSAVYAVGIWTMVGSYAYFRYTGRYEDIQEKRKWSQPEPDPNQVVYKTAHSKTVIVYRKDFVPYTTRIHNFIQSFSNTSDTGDSDK
ncbi:hypothetical protein Q5P01_026042 [Channa striata]|uniref:Small integral membrane protein 26 n=1 Tax=Channa striata TaxID=64152 RepID=A0AA88IZ87_CHASR|nr:hypothetical protein Q5P01_026042 [Channa striata]